MRREDKNSVTKYSKYDVVYGELPQNGESIQSGYRPLLVIQNNIGNKYSPTLLVIPMTTQLKNTEQPTHTIIKCDNNNGLSAESMLIAEQITTISKSNVRKIGRITDRETQKNIFRCFIYAAAYGDFDQDLKELQFC
ncbi:type II toxin-antitoxin system PemK/MazF family toxin [Lacrimispora indolis]|uniref:type II toxin-antitoxin system PemK/MazF family toxin n=1 Tax=Lacrimispora indolis TaxID=69825 RepID=UPI00046299E7|nr:type II toxin-antitoxin system PemK/MazF family toxin [[Clostridium] methoxybenzovorans]